MFIYFVIKFTKFKFQVILPSIVPITNELYMNEKETVCRKENNTARKLRKQRT